MNVKRKKEENKTSQYKSERNRREVLKVRKTIKQQKQQEERKRKKERKKMEMDKVKFRAEMKENEGV